MRAAVIGVAGAPHVFDAEFGDLHESTVSASSELPNSVAQFRIA
jgi:hypothetical protein